MDAPVTEEARAAIVAADDGSAAKSVAALIRSLGFEPVIAESLAAGRHAEPGTPYFNVPATAEQLAQQWL